MQKKLNNLFYYIKNYKLNSLFIKNFVIIFVLMILPLVGIILYNNSNINDVTEQEIKDINYSSLLRVRDMIDNIMGEMKFVASQISSDKDVRLYMIQDEKEYSYHNLKDIFYIYASNMYSYIDSVYIYSAAQDSIITNDSSAPAYSLNSFEDKYWYDYYKNNQDKYSIIKYRKKNKRYPFVISIIRPAYIYNNNNQIVDKIGATVINIDVKTLSNIIYSKSKDRLAENLFIVDSIGQIIYSNDYKYLDKNMKELSNFQNVSLQESNTSSINDLKGQKYVYSSVNSRENNFKYISFVPLGRYQEKLIRSKNFIIKYFLFGTIASLLVSFLVSFKTFNPVKNIISVIENPEYWKQKRLKNSQSEQLNELQYISNSILKLIYSNRDLKDKMKDQIENLHKAELLALEAQINPHFLFNTLENIKWKAIALTREDNDVSEMIENLSDMFRLSWDMEEGLVMIKEEIKHSRIYVDIMQKRYPDDFSVQWKIDQSIMENKIIKISIQPLIENAITHGIIPAQRSGVVTISGKKEDNKIIIRVSDNGVGIPEDELIRLNENLQKGFVYVKGHIGLRNINQRIKLVMGMEYGLNISNNFYGGTTCEIIIPGTL